MRKKLTQFLLAVGCVTVSLTAQAQETQFSQFYASSLYLNPALAGAEQNLTFNSSFRSQWRSVSSPITTNQVSVILPFSPNRVTGANLGAVGASFFSDYAGDGNLRTTGFLATGAASIGSAMSRLTLGLQGGFTQRSLDFNNLRWGSQYNSAFGYNSSAVGLTPADAQRLDNRRTYGVFNAGLLYSYNPSRNNYVSGTSFFGGVSATNINQPNVSFLKDGEDNVPVTLKAHAGLEYMFSEKFRIAPNVLYAMLSGTDQTQLNVGSYFMFNVVDSPVGTFAYTDLVLGGFYRVGDAGIIAVGLQNPTFSLAFSYDYNTSQLNTWSSGRGAYELTFSIRNVKDKARRRFDTPRI